MEVRYYFIIFLEINLESNKNLVTTHRLCPSWCFLIIIESNDADAFAQQFFSLRMNFINVLRARECLNVM